MKFKIRSDYAPQGDQPKAIKKIVDGYDTNRFQTLLGVTGSGKTFTMANVIEKVQRPTLVLSHNKTLAAQLYSELKGFFPDNRVEYFVSYYDYYQPESYLPSSDTYIEKDAAVNSKIEQMRLKAVTSLLTRPDTIIVSSVSCIYGLGSPEYFQELSFEVKKGQHIGRQKLIQHIVEGQYERNDMDLKPGCFRVKGDTIDIAFGYESEMLRIELWGDEVEHIYLLDSLSGEVKQEFNEYIVFPGKQYVAPQEVMDNAMQTILDELDERLPELPALEAHRLKQRTHYDLEMIKELGYCNGIENYSRHFENRKAGEKPFCLLDYFPKDFLFIIDESHVTLPQLHGMYKGDYARKKNLVDYGFRLPSSFDNRPLKFEETQTYFNHVLFVSATPADYELEQSGQIVEQIVRPTGLLDPIIKVHPTKNQIDTLIEEIHQTIDKGYKVFVTTLTKRMAESLTEYLSKAFIRTRYLHSDIDTVERTEIIRRLRLNEFDVLVGINLLREGLDVPEVALVAIMDADKTGFLRNTRSLIQTIGRAARNVHGRVVMFADQQTDAMINAIKETNRRRELQIKYNEAHGITPTTIIKPIQDAVVEDLKDTKHIPKNDIPKMIVELEVKMKLAADNLEFEEAVKFRDQIAELKKRLAD